MAQTLVIGVGNPDRGDDGAGRAVARLLAAQAPGCTTFRETNGEATDVLSLIQEAAAVWLIDACNSGATPGTVLRFDLNEAPLPEAGFGASTHGFGLAQALELARTFGTLPSHCIVLAIEGEQFETGAGLSAPVARAIKSAVKAIAREVGRFVPLG